MEKQLRFDYKNGIERVFPTHPKVYNWLFGDDEIEEALLANAMAMVASKYGIDNNELLHLFPAVLRMLKSNIEWSK